MIRKTMLTCLLGVAATGVLVFAADKPLDDQRSAAQKQIKAGNYRDAYKVFHRLSLNPKNDRKLVGGDLLATLNCLRQLGRVGEIDAIRDQVIEGHKENWRLLRTAARSFFDGPHYGYIVVGEFHRGNKRGGGKYVNSFERDRIRALQLMDLARQKIGDENDKSAVRTFYLEFARYLLANRGYNEAWRLQYLTDLTKLPDYEEGYYGRWGYSGRRQTQGAPVDEQGNPIFHHLPNSYEDSKTDGERWRWMLHRTKQVDANRADEVQTIFAQFLYNQFGVQTMRQYPALFARNIAGNKADGDKQDDGGPYAVHTLGEDETLAKLANGIKRFKLPDEFNYIKIFQQIAVGKKNDWGKRAFDVLSQIFENRRQYSKAADYWRKNIEKYGPGNDNYKKKRLDQITKNWGRFENVAVHPAGEGATVEYRYRNGNKVSFEAHRIKVEKLLDDVKAYLKSKPKRLEWQKFNISNIGYKLVTENQKQYIGEKVANWDVELTPAKNHFDARTTITTPLQQAGAYLLTGKMANGNISRVVIWVDDTAIVQKQLAGKRFYFVADAVTGKPIPKANVEFFGYQQKRTGKNQYTVLTSNFAEFTDKDGQVMPGPKQLQQNHQWIAIARTEKGRLAYLGFSGVWYGRHYDHTYNQHKVFVMTDRPVYRPKQPVKFKFWVRQTKYDQKDTSLFAKRKFTVRINNPKGERVFEKKLTSDEFGGFDSEFLLPANATLGNYGIYIDPQKSDPHPQNAKIRISGGGNFRVEEYKKPEFQVTVEAPDKPVSLGEKITATIKAKYYFGGAVTQAKVHYKVTRTSYTKHWFPVAEWDWLYGRGYWWFSYDYDWYPGWGSWGCKRPSPFWWPARRNPPEVVLDNEVNIGEDGTVKVEIDTALAKEIHGDLDHQYSITAEVVDQSRRTIVGTGSVLVAREPFKIFTWVDRGHYRVGDVVTANFKAQTLDQKPVEGKGELTLFNVAYNDRGQPTETEVQNWDLDTNDRGKASIQLKASAAGQYRLSYSLTDSEGHTIEGGYVFNVMGVGFDGNDFRFSNLELITDKREYKPGEKVRLMINTNRIGSTVVLFIRPVNGICPPPQIIRLNGKSTVRDIAVVQKDMPNFFIEAFTISGAKLYSETREVIVPPEKRIVNVEIQPSAEQYLPGAEAKVKVKLTDLAGNPFVGSIVLSIYDKSVEYISGGSNVADIKEFFWKWRRRHYPSTQSSLQRYFNNLLKRGEIGMGNLGTFGHLVAQLANNGRGGKDKNVDSEKQQSAGSKLRRAKRSMAKAPAMAGALKESKKADGYASADRRKAVADSADGTGKLVQPTVRKNFADTAYWAAAITANKQGMAEISLAMPENLTSWKIRAWTIGHGTRVGQGTAEVVTSKNLLVRMQAPRFFTQKDEVVLSANVHNYLKVAKRATIVLELDGEFLSPLDSLSRTVEIEPNGEQRIDWRVKAVNTGEAVVRMKALTDEESDAMEMRFPVYVHGMLKTESFTGSIRPDKNSASITMRVPAERRINQTRLEVRYSPTLAGALVDALPYLVSYPYKTTDTTLHRFLPTVITQNILKGMNIDLKAIQEKRTNLNAQEIGADPERAKQWKHYKHNPVFDENEVARMVKAGVKDLTSMQLSDGGWGWFSGYGERSWPHTTALVVHGLQIAAENEVAIVPGVLQKGVAWLKKHQDEQVRRLNNAPKKKKPYKTQADNLDAFVFMVLVDAGVVDDEMQSFLYRDRTKLSVYAKGMYGLALYKLKDNKKLTMIIRNIDQYLVQDDENQTAYLKMPEGTYWWHWYGSETEANAYYLKLLSKTDPKSEKASRLVKYLLNNRKHATYWNSTRDTAICVEAMAEYLKASGEDRPDMVVEVFMNGQKQKEVTINAKNLFSFDNKFVMVGDAVESGIHKIELRKKGKGPLYFNAYLTNFTLEDPITEAGLEVKIHRKYYRLVRKDKDVKVAGSRGQAVDQRVEKYERVEIPNLGTVKSGQLVEIEIEIDSKNDYEYILFEDKKAAGFEPVALRSGYNSNSLGAYMELRDERVVFFVRRLARGKHSVSYRMRAEIPGKYSALPTKGYAMYAPELKGNSNEIKVIIEDTDILAIHEKEKKPAATPAGEPKAGE